MGKGPPNPNDEESYREIEIRHRMADASSHENSVWMQHIQMSSIAANRQEFRRQARKGFNLAFALVIVGVLLLFLAGILSFVAMLFFGKDAASLVQLDGAIATIAASIFGVAYLFHRISNRSLNVDHGLMPPTNRTDPYLDFPSQFIEQQDSQMIVDAEKPPSKSKPKQTKKQPGSNK